MKIIKMIIIDVMVLLMKFNNVKEAPDNISGNDNNE